MGGGVKWMERRLVGWLFFRVVRDLIRSGCMISNVHGTLWH